MFTAAALGWMLATSSPAISGNRVTDKAAPVFDIRAWGAKLDGVTNDAPALQAALHHAADVGGGVLLLPRGRLAINSVTLAARRAFVVPNGLTIQGDASGSSEIVVLGSKPVNELFFAPNPRNVWFKNVGFVGNSVYTGCAGCAGALIFYGEPGETEPMHDFGCIDCRFDNWNADYWVYVRNDGSAAMRHVVFDHAVVRSRPGNLSAKAPGAIGVPAGAFAVLGGLIDARGEVEDVGIDGAEADGAFLKTFCTFWSGVRTARCSGNHLANFGAHVGSNVGAYAILAYHSAGDVAGHGAPPTGIFIENNTIENVNSNGVYMASPVDVTVSGNTCRGQSDHGDAALPKGCYSLNGASGNVVVSGNVAVDAYHGITVVPGADHLAAEIKIQGNRITSDQPSAVGILVLANRYSSASTVTLVSNDISLTGPDSRGIFLRSNSPAVSLGEIAIDGGRVSGAYSDIDGFDDEARGCVVAARLVLKGGVRLDGHPSRGGLTCAKTPTPIEIEGAVVDGRSFPRAAPLADLRGDADVKLDDLTIQGLDSGRTTDEAIMLGGTHAATSPGAVKRSGGASETGAFATDRRP